MTSVDHDGDGIPEVIPRVEFAADGEPMIAREMVVKPSPVPRSLTIILILLAAFSVGYTFYEQDQRQDAADAQQVEDDAQDKATADLVRDLQVQAEQSTKERERLRTLVLGILAADTEEERRLLLEEFALAEADDAATTDSTMPSSTDADGTQDQTPAGEGERPQGQAPQQPAPRPDQSRPPSTQPEPEPDPSDPPAVVDVPSVPLPVPLPLGDCIDTPLGRVCT